MDDKDIEKFIEKYCIRCGGQLCTGPNSEFADGCSYWKQWIKLKIWKEL